MTLRVERIYLETIPEFTLRQSDALECVAGGMLPEIAVRRSVAAANQAYAHYIDGDLVCLWGWRWEDYVEKSATMWLLSTEGADKHKIAFGRATRHMLDLLQTQMTSITILVHNQHAPAIKWLEWLGFARSRSLTELFTEMKKERV